MSKILIFLKNLIRHEENNGVIWLLETPYRNY